MQRVFRIAAATAMVVGGFVFRAPPPAVAISAGTVTIVGAVVLPAPCPGLGNVVMPGPTPVTCPFVIVPVACADAAVHVLKAAPPASAGLCATGIGGVVTGSCGLYFGTGAGGFVDSVGIFRAITFVFTGVGTSFVVTGDVASPPQGGLFYGIGEVLAPNIVLTPAGGSCAVGTATTFPIVLTGAFELA